MRIKNLELHLAAYLMFIKNKVLSCFQICLKIRSATVLWINFFFFASSFLVLWSVSSDTITTREMREQDVSFRFSANSVDPCKWVCVFPEPGTNNMFVLRVGKKTWTSRTLLFHSHSSPEKQAFVPGFAVFQKKPIFRGAKSPCSQPHEQSMQTQVSAPLCLLWPPQVCASSLVLELRHQQDEGRDPQALLPRRDDAS